MPNKHFDSWDTLTEAVQHRCKTILDKDVAPIAKKIVRNHIETDIYGVYTPRDLGWVDSNWLRATYERRYSLLKRGAIYHKFTTDKSDEIMITSDAKASPAVVKGWSFRHRYAGAFLKLLETGNMGIWSGGFPRPAIGNAQKEINRSSEIRRVIQQGLDR